MARHTKEEVEGAITWIVGSDECANTIRDMLRGYVEVIEGKEIPKKSEEISTDFIRWNGGKCPVDERREVIYITRNKIVGTSLGKYLDWSHESDPDSGDIMFYIDSKKGKILQWDGGDRLVPKDTPVRVFFRNGLSNDEHTADRWFWHRDKVEPIRDHDIIAYEVLEDKK